MPHMIKELLKFQILCCDKNNKYYISNISVCADVNSSVPKIAKKIIKDYANNGYTVCSIIQISPQKSFKEFEKLTLGNINKLCKYGKIIYRNKSYI